MATGAALAALSIIPAGAIAADLGVPRAPVAAAITVPAVFNWSGFYLGADVGYLGSTSVASIPGFPVPTDGRPNPSGFKIGAHVGYRHQFVSNLVLGLEGDLSLVAGSSRTAQAATLTQWWRVRATMDGSVRATLGFAVNRSLLYTTAGVAFADFAGCSVTVVATNPCVAGSNFSGLRTGWTVGAGLAYAVTDNWSVRAEYLYANYGSKTYSTPIIGFGTSRYRTDTHAVRVGVSYLFATGGTVSARY